METFLLRLQNSKEDFVVQKWRQTVIKDEEGIAMQKKRLLIVDSCITLRVTQQSQWNILFKAFQISNGNETCFRFTTTTAKGTLSKPNASRFSISLWKSFLFSSSPKHYA